MCTAIIGGTGIDEMEEFLSGDMMHVRTGFGEADVIRSQARDRLYFLPRHGVEHNVAPSQINYRAQMAALKKLGVTSIIGICAVGSLNPKMQPGHFAVLSDFIDITRHRVSTFFDSLSGCVVHTDFSQPYCPEISAAILSACHESCVTVHQDATYVGVDGPRYESPSEVRLYASWGGDVIGMTNLPEVVLAREAGICYGALAIVTNLAAGLSEAPLEHSEVRAAMTGSADGITSLVIKAIEGISECKACRCQSNTGLVL